MKFKTVLKTAAALCMIFCVRACADGADSSAVAQMTALNMAAVSVRHITAARDRLVLDQESSNIVNNLSLGDLGDASEVLGVYTRLLDAISALRLSDEERQVFAGIYEHRQKNALNSVLSGLHPSASSLRHFFASLFSGGVNAYFGVRRELAEIHRAAGQKSWELQKESLTALHQLQKELLEASWLLLRRHGLPERYRITQEDLDCLEQATAQSDWNKAEPMFDMLESAFASFPSYWFYRADAAWRGGDAQAAARFLNEYDRLWTRVLRRDPCRARADMLRLVLDESLDDEQTRRLVARIRENSSPRDWLNNLFCGTLLWALGDRDEAERLVQSNILFETEKDISTVVLSHMRRGTFDESAFCADLRAALTGEAAPNPESELLTAWFDGQDSLAVKLASERERGGHSALSACVLWLLCLEPEVARPARAAEWKACFEQRIARSVLEADRVLTNARVQATRGNARAALLCAVAAESGWGSGKDPFAAAKWYKAASEAGSVPAQERYAALCMSGEGAHRDSAEAVRWYQTAAGKGGVESNYQLGRLFRTGQGASRDLAGAARHFFAAAQKGHAPAQAALGELYSKGAGVPQDYFEAYKWSMAALLGGAENARRTLNVIEGNGVLRKRRLAPAACDRAAAEGRALWKRTREE